MPKEPSSKEPENQPERLSKKYLPEKSGSEDSWRGVEYDDDDPEGELPESGWSKYPFFVPTLFVVSMYEMTFNSACRKIRAVKKKCGDPPKLPLWRFCEHEGLTLRDVQMFYGY